MICYLQMPIWAQRCCAFHGKDEFQELLQFSQRLVLLDRVAHAIESRRLVLRVSSCIGPAHAEARRRGDRERSAHKTGWTGLHPSPEAGTSRNAADPDTRHHPCRSVVSVPIRVLFQLRRTPRASSSGDGERPLPQRLHRHAASRRA